ncbi:MAG TPA: D-alanyl-D-alanine carboxypeptidase/D-alanyl-D-alanine-endopeptidase [Candidatus Acidoferrales bacterium]|nr:D-alanyl-D-alanine carboxypeptidase/D-alanyl-D-alanine-endopeptidase [Candidatus Acidoferrales bacterium]
MPYLWNFLIAALLVCVSGAWGFGNRVKPEPRNPSGDRSEAATNARASKKPAARAGVAAFRARVDAAFAQTNAPRALWGILVEDRDSGEPLFDLNSDRSFAPASNAKIVTSILALSSLGPDYKFRTTLESNGALSDSGQLSGDLFLMGRGDPTLSNRVFPYSGKVEHQGTAESPLAELADAAVAKGLREVDGDVVGDDSFFPYDPYPAGWSVGDLFFEFGAPVSAIDFNDNTVSINIQPAAIAGDPPTVTFAPAAAAGTISLELKTGPADEKPDFDVVREPTANFILLRGSVPAGQSATTLDFNMVHPAEIAARSLKQLLEARGVRITGTVRVHHAPPPDTSDTGDLPPTTDTFTPALGTSPLVLAEHDSPRLLEIVRMMNKISQNLYAELLLRTVGREKGGTGTSEVGLKVEGDLLESVGVIGGDIDLSDGSGLSRDDLVTPRGVVALLRYAARQPWGEDFLSTLPISGVDGTLESRMKSTPATGLIQAKTGSLEHDNSLSGYATTLRGEHLVFAMFGNNNPDHGRDATQTLDAISVAMVETLGRPPKSKKKQR